MTFSKHFSFNSCSAILCVLSDSNTTWASFGTSVLSRMFCRKYNLLARLPLANSSFCWIVGPLIFAVACHGLPTHKFKNCKSQALSPSRRHTQRVFIAAVGVNNRNSSVRSSLPTKTPRIHLMSKRLQPHKGFAPSTLLQMAQLLQCSTCHKRVSCTNNPNQLHSHTWHGGKTEDESRTASCFARITAYCFVFATSVVFSLFTATSLLRPARSHALQAKTPMLPSVSVGLQVNFSSSSISTKTFSVSLVKCVVILLMMTLFLDVHAYTTSNSGSYSGFLASPFFLQRLHSLRLQIRFHCCILSPSALSIR